jgi:DNA-directed RNA polymerase subunit RPC12/RpoP
MLQAISAISEVLALCGANAEENESCQAVETLGARIRCESCKSKVVMSFRNVVHRYFYLALQKLLLHLNCRLAMLNDTKACKFR